MSTSIKRPTKDFSNAVGTPSNLRTSESGLTGQAIQTSFEQVIRSTAQNSDLTIIGDSNHSKVEIRNDAMNTESLIAMAETGVTHLFVEVDQTLQPLADDLIQNKSSPDAKEKFSRAFYEEYGDAKGNETGAYTRQLIDTILTADRLGIQVHFANPANGREESNAAEEYAENNLDDEEGIKAKYEIANKARFNDQQLAEFINQTAKGEKSVVIYGSSHASRFGDFEKFYEGSTAKIDIYNNVSEYAQQIKVYDDVSSKDLRFNEDKPEMVYFKEGQTALPTYNTPPEVLKDLSRNGKLIDSPAPREGTEITDPALIQKPAANAPLYLSTGTSSPN